MTGLLNKEQATELISRRRRQILIHSALYYRMNENIISDHAYDAMCKELAELQIKYPQSAREAVYADAYAEFDGSTGFHLPIHEPDVITRAHHVLAWHKKRQAPK